MVDIATLTEIMNYGYAAKNELKHLARNNGTPVMITWHWSAGWYDQPHHDYHINILGGEDGDSEDGNVYIAESDFAVKLPHTWMKNTANIGVSLCCCADANTNYGGSAPPTSNQIEAMSQITAVLSEALNLPIDVEHIATHGERADNEDWDFYYPEYTGYENNIYGPKSTVERWDLDILFTAQSPEFDPWDEEHRGGTVLRNKTKWYRQQWYGH